MVDFAGRYFPDAYVFVLLAVLAVPVLWAADKDKKTEDNKGGDKGWVQIFNGKDLTGWEVYPDGTGNWKVKDGILIGSEEQSHLFTKRKDYKNFRYRVVAMINDEVTLKRFYREKNHVRLEPSNKAMDPIIVNSTEDARILGVLVGVMRKC